MLVEALIILGLISLAYYSVYRIVKIAYDRYEDDYND